MHAERAAIDTSRHARQFVTASSESVFLAGLSWPSHPSHPI
jgi:hypothetical protein